MQKADRNKEYMGRIREIMLWFIITFLPFAVMLTLKLTICTNINWFWVWCSMWGMGLLELLYYIILVLVINMVMKGTY